jgi:hypothetical protein
MRDHIALAESEPREAVIRASIETMDEGRSVARAVAEDGKQRAVPSLAFHTRAEPVRYGDGLLEALMASRELGNRTPTAPR